METKVLNYRIIIWPELVKRRKTYVALSPTLGVSDWGKTVEEALDHIKEGIECHLESLVKHKKSIPQEESLSEFMVATTKVSVPHPVNL